MRLRDIEKGKRAIKRVPFRPATGAAQPGRAPLEPHADEVALGVRVMTGEETAEVYKRARADASAAGVDQWDEDDPICRLHRMVHTVALCCIEVPDDPGAPIPDEPRPFFESAEEIRSSHLVGRDNIVYLFDCIEEWQMDCGGVLEKNLTPEQVIGIMLQEAERPESADSPLDRMRPGLRRSCFRTSGALLGSLLQDRSHSSSPGDSSTTIGSESSYGARKKKAKGRRS